MPDDRSPSFERRAGFGRRRFLTGLGGSIGLAALGGTALAACAGPAPTAGPAGGPPQTGGRLKAVIAGRSAATDVLDPHVAGSAAGGALSKNVYDHLVAYNNDLTLRYRLAESLEPNADGTAWRIRLREGVTFSDGKPLISRDILWSLQRMLDPAKPSSGDLSVVDFGATKADGDLGVVVAMKEPLADFGSVLAGWYVYVIQDGTTTFDPTTLPVGTGPFVLRSWSPGDRTVLARNERYWENGQPYLDEIEIIQISETDARLNAFLSGEADLIQELTYLQAHTTQSQDGIYLITPPAGNMASIRIQTDVAPFDDVRIRQALRLSIDREAIVRTVYYGFGAVGNDLYGKGAPFYADQLPQRRYDPAEARRLLREAGRENLTVTLYTADASPGMVETATLFAEHAKASGITVQLETVPADTYFSEVVGVKPMSQGGWWNYSLDYYYGQTMTSSSPSNDTAWRRPAWDGKFAQARASLDQDARRRLYLELQEELWNEGGDIVHSFAKQPSAARNHVRGVPEGVPGTDDWANYRVVWLAKR